MEDVEIVILVLGGLLIIGMVLVAYRQNTTDDHNHAVNKRDVLRIDDRVVHKTKAHHFDNKDCGDVIEVLDHGMIKVHYWWSGQTRIAKAENMVKVGENRHITQ